MARLPYLDKKDLAPEFQGLLERPINLHRILVHSPEGRRASAPLGKYIRWGSKLSPVLRELAILEIGYLSRAAYEWSHHTKIALEFGVSEDQIRQLTAFNEGSPTSLDKQTLTVLTAAREMTLSGAVTPATFAELKTFLDNTLLVDLIVTMAHYNGTVRLLASFEIDVEEEYLPYLEKFPLPA